MSSLAFLLQPQLLPFAGALGLVAGLCLLEVLMAFAGLSMLGDAGADAGGDLGVDAGTEVGAEVGAEVGIDAEADADFDTEVEAGGAAAGGLLSWLGVGQVPLMIWLAGTLTAFGIAGYGLQLLAATVLGSPAPALLAAGVALVPGVAAGASVARLLGRLVPKTESTAISTRSYGGRRGVITTGTARRDNPAEVRFRDAHGNTHYTMVEPIHDDDELPEGTEVAIVRLREGQLRAIRFDDVKP
ncbi:MAG: OB-fold-containig protein [Pseudomonadota bacterium]